MKSAHFSANRLIKRTDITKLVSKNQLRVRLSSLGSWEAMIRDREVHNCVPDSFFFLRSGGELIVWVSEEI